MSRREERCQQCFQQLHIQQIQEIFQKENMKDAYDQFAQMREETLALGEPDDKDQQDFLEQDAMFFGAQEGSSADLSSAAIKAIKIKDFAEAASKNIQLKHPVCFECFDEILEQLGDKVKQQETERDMYKEELENIETEVAASKKQVVDQELLDELKKLEEEESKLDKELSEIDNQEKIDQQTMMQLTKSKGAIQEQEESLWHKVNDYEKELSTQLEQNKQVDGQMKNLTQLYKRLRQTNFINEVFHISSQDQFGTISGFRLGRLTQLVDVDWDEISAALGQAVYLMAVIAHRFGYKFEKYKINLCGAMSTIQLKYAPSTSQKATKYELYINSQVDSNEKRFNTGLEYMLDALKGQMDFVRNKMQDSGQSIISTYQIDGDKIGGESIQYNANSSHEWTKAMKYFLTNLQWLVYMTQLKDIKDQQDNLDTEHPERAKKNQGNFNTSGL